MALTCSASNWLRCCCWRGWSALITWAGIGEWRSRVRESGRVGEWESGRVGERGSGRQGDEERYFFSRSLALSLPDTRRIVMASIPMEYGLLLAGTLFALG